MMSAEDDRCAYSYDAEGEISTWSCIRLCYRDSEFCWWHTRSENKDAEFLTDKEIRGERLDGAILDNIKIDDGIELQEVSLKYASFNSSSIKRANISDSDLSNAEFHDVTIVDSNFRGCNLSNAELHQGRLIRTDFSESFLRSTEISNIDIDNCDFTSTDQIASEWADCYIRDCDFSESIGDSSEFRDTTIVHSDFSSVKLREPKLEDTDIYGCDFGHTELLKINSKDNSFEECDFTDGAISNGKFQKGQFSDTSFDNTDLSGTMLKDIQATGNSFRSADLFEVRFVDSNCEFCNFVRASLQGADFQNTRLYASEFSEARIDSTTKFDITDVYGSSADDLRKSEAVFTNLSNLTEKNGATRMASEFRYLSRVTRRQIAVAENKLVRWLSYVFFGSITGYGERPARIVASSFVIVQMFAYLFFLLNYPNEGGLSIIDATTLSVSAFTGLASVQGSSLVDYLVALESFIGLFLIVIFAISTMQRIS